MGDVLGGRFVTTTWTVLDDAAALGQTAALRMIEKITEAIQARGRATLALSGGSTPYEAFSLMANRNLPWSKTFWFWVDERAVPVGDPRSNYSAAEAALGLNRKNVGGVYRMQAERENRAAAAQDYEQIIARHFADSPPSFDVMVLGIGDDGHTASLFPGLPQVEERRRLVVDAPAQPDKKLEARLTFTPALIWQARYALILAKGSSKRVPIEQATSPGPLRDIPARLFQQIQGNVEWMVDRAARPDGPLGQQVR